MWDLAKLIVTVDCLSDVHSRFQGMPLSAGATEYRFERTEWNFVVVSFLTEVEQSGRMCLKIEGVREVGSGDRNLHEKGRTRFQ